MAKAASRKKPVESIKPVVQSGGTDTETTWELDNTTVSGDAGNGKTAMFRMNKGKLQHVTLPTARTRLRDSTMSKDVDGISSADTTKVEFLGTLYGVGDGVWDLSEYPVETFSNSEMRYGSEHHIFMLLTSIAMLGTESGSELTLVTSAPPGLVSQVAGTIKANILKGDSGLGDGLWHIALNGEPFEYVIKRVLVIAEGINAYAAYAYDANGNNVKLPHPTTGIDMLSGIVSVNDGGMGTYDRFTIHNGKLNPQSIEHATDANGGIQVHLIQPLIDYIQAEFRKAGHPTLSLSHAQVDGWLRQWAKGGFKQTDADVILGGLKINFHTIGERLRQQYARWIIEEKLEPAFRQGADTILEVGGAWVYTHDAILAAYPKRTILYPAMIPHLKDINLWDLNAYGGLPLVANNQKVFKKVKA